MKGKQSEAVQFLTVDEAAQLVGLSHWTLRSWLQKGRLSRFKSGSRTVVSRSQLLGLLKPREFDTGTIQLAIRRPFDSSAPHQKNKSRRNEGKGVSNMTNAIDLLLQDKQYPNAVKLLTFHYANPEFLPRIVAEFRLLKVLGRKAGSIESLIHFLRWEQHWRGDGEFEINDQLTALSARVCALLWPDINGLMKFHRCAADEIMDTHIVRQGKRYGNVLVPGNRTLPEGCGFLPPEPDASGIGLVRPIRLSDYHAPVLPPPVPVLDRPATIHALITETEAASVASVLRDIVDNSPNPKHPILLAWLRHAEAQPEMFAFMQMKLRQREPAPFSPRSILEYCRWSIRRTAASHKQFSLPSRFNGLYCRALILLNREFNGFCHFKHDGKTGRSNQLLRCNLSSEPVNGEPYCRLMSAKEGK
jgi:excisionase family DNA binding protein